MEQSAGKAPSGPSPVAADPAGVKKAKKVSGVVYVDREKCKGCGFCVEFCPPHCLDLDKAYNAKGYHPPVLARPDDCNGCDLCGLYCPDFSIFAVMVKNKGL